MRRRLVAGNWKMHGGAARNQSLLEGMVTRAGSLQQVDCAVCVPFPYLSQAQALLTGSVVGWRLAEGSPDGELCPNLRKI